MNSKGLAAAETGDPEIQFLRAQELALGESADLAQARMWYEKAAEQGHTAAQNNFGCMLLDGLGGPRDGEKAVLWFQRAAEAGDAEAQFNLAQRYVHGDVVPIDDALTAFWAEKASANWHVKATTILGTCYLYGRGVEKNLLHAARLYVRGARGRDVVAHGNLASCRRELEDLAQTGNKAAALITALLYAEGLGGEIDNTLAKYWLTRLDELHGDALDSDDESDRLRLFDILYHPYDPTDPVQVERRQRAMRLRFTGSSEP